MTKYLCILALSILLPTAVYGATLTELQAQIAALMAQISALQTLTPSPVATTSNPPQPVAQCPSITKNLYRGLRSPEVTQLQQFLIGQGFLAQDSATGFFGALTEVAVKKLQCTYLKICSGSPNSNGFGVVGPRTRVRIAETCARAATPMLPPPPTSASTSLPTPSPTGSAPTTSSLQAATCSFNGQIVAHQTSVTAYQVSAVSEGQVCRSQARTCQNGTLSGTYTFASCTVGLDTAGSSDVSYNLSPQQVFPSQLSLLPPGITYSDTVPDTLDLAERASSYIRGQVQTIAPSLHSSPAGWIGSSLVASDHWGCSVSDARPCFFYNWPNWGLVMMGLAQAREMSAYDRSDSDSTLGTQYRMLSNMIDPALQKQFAQYFNGSVLLQPGSCTTDACISASVPGLQALIQHWKQNPTLERKGAVDLFLADLLKKRKIFTNGARSYKAFEWPSNTTFETDIGYLGDYYGPFINGKALETIADWYILTRNSDALVAANELSDFIRNYKGGMWWQSADETRFPPGSGHFAGHIYSWLQLGLGLAKHATALRLTDPNSSLARTELRLANDQYLFIKDRARAGKVGHFGEIGTTGDMVRLAILLTEQGIAYYYEDAESWTRNALAEGQIDPSAASMIPNLAGTKYENTNIGTKITGMFFADATHAFAIPSAYLFATTDYAPNAFAGMYAVWDRSVVYFNNFAQINFLFNRASKYLDVRSDLPYRGRIEVQTNQSLGTVTDFGLRIPSWVDRNAISISKRGISGVENALPSDQWSWINGAPYVQVKRLEPNTVYTVTFPISVYTQSVHELRATHQGWYEGSYPTTAGPERLQTYTATFRGDTLVNVSPRPSGGIPRYQRQDLASLGQAESIPPTKTVMRFVHNGISSPVSISVPSVSATPAPTITLTIDGLEGTVQRPHGSAYTIAWTSSNVSSCAGSVYSADGATYPWNINPNTAVSFDTSLSATTVSYTLSCSDVSNHVLSKTVTITSTSD